MRHYFGDVCVDCGGNCYADILNDSNDDTIPVTCDNCLAVFWTRVAPELLIRVRTIKAKEVAKESDQNE